MVTGLSRFSWSVSVRVRSRWGPVGCLLDLVAFVTSFRSPRYVTGLSACCRASRGGFVVFVVDSVSCGRSGLCRFVLSIFLPYDTAVSVGDGLRTCVAAGALAWRRCQSLGYSSIKEVPGDDRPALLAALRRLARQPCRVPNDRRQPARPRPVTEPGRLDVISAQCPSCRGEEIQPTAGKRRQ